VNTAKGAKEIADGGPHTFCRVGVDFADSITIIITGPFSPVMTHRGMGPNDVIVAAPFIGKDLGLRLSESVDMLKQRWLIGMVNDRCSYCT